MAYVFGAQGPPYRNWGDLAVPRTDNALELMVRKLSVHAPLGEEDRQAILALPYVRRKIAAGDVITHEGERSDQCGVLVSGFAYRQKSTGDGARQIVALHIPGEPLGLANLALNVADHTVEALTDAEVAFVPNADLMELAIARRAVGHAFLVKLLVEGSVAREWLLNVGRRDGPTKLAHLLCEFALRLEAVGLAEDYGYELPMTQEQLGDSVGLTPIHVNRCLKALEDEGLIKRDGRKVGFPDWRRIRDKADFTDQYLHLDTQLPAARSANLSLAYNRA